MPKLFQIVILICTLAVYSSCSDDSSKVKEKKKDNSFSAPPKPAINFDNYAWLEGTWKGQVKEKFIVEEWKRAGDKYIGISYSINNEDTTYLEKLYLEVIDHQIYYSADVPENREIVSFKLVEEKPNFLLFENEENEFPSRINYIFNNPSRLAVRISGKKNGERVEKGFYYEREE